MVESELINKIISDVNKTIDDRIDEVFNLRGHETPEDHDKAIDLDIEIFSSLIEMLKREDRDRLHVLELLQLYVLLAEAYVIKKDFRPLKQITRSVIETLQYGDVSWEIMEQTLPRIIDALGQSVYNYSLYELLMFFLHAAFIEGKLNSDMKGRIRKLLKLKILLPEPTWVDYFLDRPMQEAIAGIMTSEELIKIILHPEIGHIKKDPIEYTRHWEDIYYDMEERLEYRFANAPRHMGFCFIYWNAQQELLENEYNIKWRNPAQMNPTVIFD